MNIRNFCILAHIDHGKSTLADRFLEVTGTIEKRKMREQVLDQMDIEREKGITIKMQPVRMIYHADRGITQKSTLNYAEDSELLYKDLTYKIRGALFQVRKKIGLGHKEQVYHRALEIEFKNIGVAYESKKNIPILYEGKSVGTYQPDFVIQNTILIELKALPEIGRLQIEQVWSYLKGCEYKLALLVNYGSTDLEIKRIIYDTARGNPSVPRSSVLSPRESTGVNDQIKNNDYILNLIDTPGHVDFSYEVSRALAAVEGAILLVDATQGVQAQTIANLHLAEAEGLVIIPVVNKIDLPSAEVEKTEEEIMELLSVPREAILRVSGKTGEGVEALLAAVIERVPPPAGNNQFPQDSNQLSIINNTNTLRALVFDSFFDSYQGVIAEIRVVDGVIRTGERVRFCATGAECEVLEVGVFVPERRHGEALGPGEIGYIATGIKEPERVRVGDTVTKCKRLNGLDVEAVEPLAGYREPAPMVFSSLFPEDQDEYERLRNALKKLKLNDAAVVFEPEESGTLGRGFRTGFLGMLHMEIVSERLRREYGLALAFTNPSVTFRVLRRDGRREVVYTASRMPESGDITGIQEQWVWADVILPSRFLGSFHTLVSEHGGKICETAALAGDRLLVRFEAPLREIIIDFYDTLKSISEGFASMSYAISGWREADLVRIDFLVAGERMPALSEVVPREKAYYLGRTRVAALKEVLPKRLFAIALQAEVGGKIIARETISALKKDVTGYLYGGDRTRKMKLWKKQQRGKKRLKEEGRVEIPPDVFLKLLRRT